jgi:hypothetical protein
MIENAAHRVADFLSRAACKKLPFTKLACVQVDDPRNAKITS